MKRHVFNTKLLIDHVCRTRLAMSCGSRDDSLSWKMSRVKQGSAFRADDMDHRVEGRCNVIASREEGDERNKDRSFHESVSDHAARKTRRPLRRLPQEHFRRFAL